MNLNASLLHLLRRASQAADFLFAAQCRDGQMTARQFAILAAVGANDGAPQSVLVEETGIDRSTLSEVMNRLDSKGLLTRQRNASDARAYRVHLTPAGAEALAAGSTAAEHVDRQLSEMTGPEEAAELRRLLQIIATSQPEAAPHRLRDPHTV